MQPPETTYLENSVVDVGDSSMKDNPSNAGESSNSSEREASASQAGRGKKRNGEQDHQRGDAFAGVVPDFIQSDWIWARPRSERRNEEGHRKVGRARIGGGLHWVVHLAVISQRLARVILPDVLLGQVIWGGERDR